MSYQIGKQPYKYAHEGRLVSICLRGKLPISFSVLVQQIKGRTGVSSSLVRSCSCETIMSSFDTLSKLSLFPITKHKVLFNLSATLSPSITFCETLWRVPGA
jgi:hypothetical protein